MEIDKNSNAGEYRRSGFYHHVAVIFLGALIGWHIENIVYQGHGSAFAASEKILWIECCAAGLWLLWNIYSIVLSKIADADLSKTRRSAALTYLPFALLILYPGLILFVKSFGRGRFALLLLEISVVLVVFAKAVHFTAVVWSVGRSVLAFIAICVGAVATWVYMKPPALSDAIALKYVIGTQLAALTIFGCALLVEGIARRKGKFILAGAIAAIIGFNAWNPVASPPPSPALPDSNGIAAIKNAQVAGLFSGSGNVVEKRFTINSEHRDALIFTTPDTIKRNLFVAGGAKLKFGIGVPFFAPGLSDEGVVFSVLINGETVWTLKLDPVHRIEDRLWRDAEVDLSPWARTTAELAIRTEGATHGAFANTGIITPDPETDRPNIIVILIDTLRADHTNINGYRRATTPLMQRQAAEGVVFENAISTAPWTEPATASLLTGLLPGQMGMVFSWSIMLSPDSKTLGQYLRSKGYATAGISGSPMISAVLFFDQGFDVFNEECTPFFAFPSARCVTDEAIERLDAIDDAPFFLYLHYIDTHDPYKAPPPYRGMFSPGYTGKDDETAEGRIMQFSLAIRRGRKINPPDNDVRYLLDQYDGEIAYLDAQVGRLIDDLKRRGIMDNTVIFITSDHGEEFMEHGILGHFHNLHNTLVHIPMVVVGPDIPKGARIAQPVSIADIAPTVLDMVNIEPDKKMWGKSMLPLIDGESTPSRYCFSQMGTENVPQWSMLKDDFKLILSPDGEKKLFDLDNDPGEFRNIAGKGLPEEKDLSDALLKTLKWIDTHRVKARQQAKAKRLSAEEEHKKRLKALGYIND